MTVRRATSDDVAAIAELERANLRQDAWSEGLVRHGVEGELPTIHYLVAERDGTVVGHAVASIVADLTELQRISVVEEHRRSGLATRLLDAVVAEAERHHAERVLLEVREDNAAAIAFYARQGFVEIDRRRAYYADGATAIVLERHLTEQRIRPGE